MADSTADAVVARPRPADLEPPPTLVPLIDSHCHLDDPAFETDRDLVIARARAHGIRRMVAIAAGGPLTRINSTLTLAEAHADVFAAVAVHPHDASEIGEKDYEALRALWAHPRVVAVGETGLDYYYRHSPPETQRTHLRQFVREARHASLPLVIHCRDAFPDLIAILSEEDAGVVGGVIHCFSGTPADAQACVALGFHISFSGIVTFKKADAIRDAVRATPLDRLLIETDAPYLAPEPQRGRRNEPALVRQVAERVAQVTGRDIAEVAHATTRNAERLFRLTG